jgi:uncharacterized protein involved in exopolysaccharide biosynthesis
MIEEKPIPWQELLETIFRRKRSILVVALAGLALGSLFALLEPKVYEAEARILLTADAVPGPRETAMAERDITAELALLQSPVLIRSVLEEIGTGDDEVPAESGTADDETVAELDATTAESGATGDETLAESGATGDETLVESDGGLFSSLFGESSDDSTQTDVTKIAERIVAVPLARSNIVEISFVDRNPEWAVRFVNRLLEKHVERIAELAAQPEARDFFESQGIVLADRLRQAETALAEYRDQRGILAGDETALRDVLTDVASELLTAETEVLELQAQVTFLEQELERQPETIASETVLTEDDSVTLLKERILDLEIERSERLSQYRETSSVIRNLDRQIEEAERLLATKEGETLAETTTASNPTRQNIEAEYARARSELTGALARLEALDALVADYRARVREFESTSGELVQLVAQVEIAQEAHEDYLRQGERARLSRALEESRIVNVSIIDLAEAIGPLPPSRRILIPILLMVGLVMGVLQAFVRDWLDPTIRSTAQAVRLTGVPVITEIPSP